MIEKIGSVTLNLDYYKGKDLYSDGEVEDEILDIVKNNDASQYNSIIEARKSWPILYHLSHIRSNIIAFLPIGKDETVLEIGSGCGAITGKLAEKAKSVTCIELSKKRSTINAYRNKDKSNIEILVGNFQTIEKKLTRKYDVITLIGVFEYADYYIDCKTDPYAEFFKIVSQHLSEHGRLVIAIENKYGMKYFAGWKEDHFNKYFEGIEGYTTTRGVKTFSRNKLISYAENEGFSDIECYYPHPDYKLPLAIYSDEYLPNKGELGRIGSFNFDQDRLELFDVNKAFDSCIEDGMFPHYANSFLFVFGR